MQEKDNEVESRVPEDAVEEEVRREDEDGGETVEERQAEEFAEEMNAEPQNIDGETGLATPEQEAAAAEVEHTGEAPAVEDPGQEAGADEVAAKLDVPPVEEPAQEAAAEEFAEEMNAEPQNIDGETSLATPEQEAAAAEVEHTGEAPAVEDPGQEAGADDVVAESDVPAVEEPAQEAAAEEFAEEMNAEPQNFDGDAEETGSAAPPRETLSADEILAPDAGKESAKWLSEDAELTAMLEAVIYITDEPLTLEQIATALEQPRDRVKRLLNELVAEWQKPQHGLSIREVAGGYKMTTKPEHHDAVRQFVKNLKPPMKLSLPALETMAVIAYKQPVTAPEIMEIRGVQGAGVLKTLIDRKLIAPAGRKNVIGKPILYKTTKEFLVQFGLKDLSELPSVKEFEELARFSMPEAESAPEPPVARESKETPKQQELQPEPDSEPVVE